MENSSDKVTINNPADIIVITAYFIMVISVGIWVSVSKLVYVHDLFVCHVYVMLQNLSRLCFSQCSGSIVGRLEDISWQGGQ